MSRGKLVIITGINGVGKETISNMLAHMLCDAGIYSERHYEPNMEPSSTAVQKAILRRDTMTTNKDAMACYYYGIHFDAVPRFNWLRDNGTTIIADRGPETAWIYNVVMAGLTDKRWLLEMHREVMAQMAPDLTILLDTSVEVSLMRASEQIFTDQFQDEVIAKHEQRRQAFIDMARTNSTWAIVDATSDPDTVAQAAYNTVLERLGLTPKEEGE